MRISRRVFLVLAGAAAAGLLLGLRGGVYTAAARGGCSPPIVYGRSECAVCKMVVDYEPSSGAMRVVEFGRERWYYFDDLGCLAVWYRVVRERGGEVLDICVRDRVTGEWIDLRSAVVLVTDEFTSMNTGFLAARRENVERYKSGAVSWGPKPGTLFKTLPPSCLLERFRYGDNWSVPRGWDEGC